MLDFLNSSWTAARRPVPHRDEPARLIDALNHLRWPWGR